MKKMYAYALGAALFLGFAAFTPAYASSAVFNNNMYGVDCPTVAVANATTGTPTDSNHCWGTSVSATSNDVVNVVIYYNNNGSETAHNTVARLSPKSAGVSSTQVFTGSIGASNAATVTGSGTISISPAQSVTFGTVKWYKDKQGTPSPLPNGQTGAELFTTGLNLGDVLGGETCPVVAGVRDVACHEGWLMVSYRVGMTVAQPCTISINANPLTIQAGQSSTLSWNSTNCTTVSVAGPNGVISTALSGSQSVSPTYTSTYTITGSNSTGSAAPVSTTLNVSSVVINPVCTATLYPSGTQQVQAGQTSTLTWSSSGAQYVTVSGPNGVVSSALSGSIPTAPIYGTVTYTLTAGCSGMSNVVQSATFTAYTVNNGTAPTATTLAAQVSQDGTTATLNGYINSNTMCTSSFWGCGSSNVTYYFKYGTSQYGLYNQTPTQSMSSTSGNVSAYLGTVLQPNTTYYFQLIATNTYGTSYGNTLSFVTTNGAANLSAITTVPTNVVTTSARLNGLVTGSNGGLYSGVASVWFEYGTTPSLGLRTTAQTANVLSIANYFDTIATSANTTYYYRIVASANGQTVMGSTVSFSTPAVLTTTNTTTNTTNTTNTTTVVNRIGTGTGSAFLQLAITDQVQSVMPGDTLSYLVTYQNISGVTLSNVVINVILPTGVTFRQASQGLLTTNNTVATAIGTLLPAAQGTFTIQVVTSPTIVPGNTLLTTATAAFTLPTSAQDSAIAYDLDNVVTYQNNLAGLALFGAGFFPTTLFGWILLLGLLLILILIARYFYQRSNATRAVPPANMHYETETSTHTGYRGDNLPH